ncbi:hypothetical protein [Salinibacter grassmerensis]|uniref:hypothetical protein n=1 Tax=Salinibacter grassmerensis TaxID=3040353 RepID=UPI0021E84643|nr:hypothetical protein [Salinibacter grassmerensis]
MTRFITIIAFAFALVGCTGAGELAEKRGYTGAKKQCMSKDKPDVYCGGRYTLEDVQTINENNYVASLTYSANPRPDVLIGCWRSDMFGVTNCYMFEKRSGVWKVESHSQGSYRSFAY